MPDQDITDRVIAQLYASAPRRFAALLMLNLLGALLLFLALSLPLGWGQVVLFAFGALSLLTAIRLYASSAQVIELTAAHLRVQNGEVLARIDEIKKVERGAFAFKPSNGFLLTLEDATTRRWAPGLYWSFGRRIGIGGITGAPQSKGMAEAIAGLIEEHSRTQ